MALELRNGREVLHEAYVYHPEREAKVSTYTDDHTILKTQSGHTLVMNSTSNKVFTAFNGGASDIGCEWTICNINTGRLTLQMPTGETIDDSNAAGTIYSDDNTIASLTFRRVSATHHIVVAANGTWTTT